jgi:hypothetical protein
LSIAQFFCFQVRISNIDENLLWETLALVDICGVRKSEGTFKINCHATFHTEFCWKSNGVYSRGNARILSNSIVHTENLNPADASAACVDVVQILGMELEIF